LTFELTTEEILSEEILIEEPERVEHVQENAAFLRKGFEDLGLDTLGTQTCVIPVLVGDDQTALGVCKGLLELGVFTTPVVYPAVSRGQALLRCSVMATHTKSELERAIDAFRKLAPMIIEACQNPNLNALADEMNYRESKKASGFSVAQD